MIWWFISFALATPVIDTKPFATDKRAQFESHATGWMGLNKQWVRRIYVGTSVEQTKIWMSRMQSQYYRQKVNVVEGAWDEGLGNEEFLMVRIGTLGLICQGSDAHTCIVDLQSKIIETDHTCPTPLLTKQSNLTWFIPYVIDDCQIRFQGGEPTYQKLGIAFTTLPSRLVVYDQFAQSWEYTQTDDGRFIQSIDKAAPEKRTTPLDQ